MGPPVRTLYFSFFALIILPAGSFKVWTLDYKGTRLFQPGL